jgi:hypothetical protein
VPIGLNQKVFTESLGRALRDSTQGWRARELQFTQVQHEAAGRPRAIDYFHAPSRVAIELELGNQTVFSHDLLKLEIAFRNGLIGTGVILAPTAATRESLNWNPRNSYLTHENAGTFLHIFGPALTVPLVVLGLEA